MNAEEYLKQYWFEQRRIGRLMLDLTMAKHAYEQSYNDLPSAHAYRQLPREKRQRLSPVERTALVVIDQYRAEVESIEKRLGSARQAVAAIEHTVRAAGLSARETDYVRMRYFENRRVESVAQKLYCSTATCRRIRRSALCKIGSYIGR